MDIRFDKKDGKVTKQVPCYIEFSDSGQFCRIVHRSGMIIAELLMSDSNFQMRALAAYDRFRMQAGIPKNFRHPQNPYRGDVQEILGIGLILEDIQMLQKMLDETKNYNEQTIREDFAGYVALENEKEKKGEKNGQS